MPFVFVLSLVGLAWPTSASAALSALTPRIADRESTCRDKADCLRLALNVFFGIFI